MRETSIRLGLIGFITLLIVWLYHEKIEPFQSFSLRFNDLNFHLQDIKPHPDIIFVAVDEASVNRFGRWPWKRSDIAKGLEHLQSSRVILLDMIFSEPTTPMEDAILSNMIAIQSNSVCGFFLRHNATQQISSLQETLLYDSVLDRLQSDISTFNTPHFVHAPYAEVNIEPILASCTMSGAFSTLRASDQLFRSYPIAFYYKDYLYPSLAIQALRLALNQDVLRENDNSVRLGNYLIDLDDKGFVRLNYYGLDQYQVLSFGDLIDGKIAADHFKDKIVIIGITEVGVSDVRATPMGIMNGPLLHYTFISNLLSHHLISDLPSITLLLIILMILLPFFMLYISKNIIFRIISYSVIYSLVFIAIRMIFITNMFYIDAFFPLMALLMSVMTLEASSFISQERQARFIRQAFSNYLSSQLLNKLIASPESLQLGGEKKELTILFSDIRNFTAIAEDMSPQALILMMNRYFTPMTASVLEHEGMLDKYIGDAVMAFFNAPIDLNQHPDKACETALDMTQKLQLLNQNFAKDGLPFIEIGIGINTAEVVVGNMGSSKRFNYTVIGDGVNLASRIQELNKHYHTHILISEFTKAKISPHFLTRKLEAVHVKGKIKAVILYELLLDNERNQACVRAFNEALTLYEKGDFRQAVEKFKTASKFHNDNTAELFYRKAEEKIAKI
ncbi:MAG: adenylate/guanylate cyclase domain-containing protein [Epsilonproteobacteria bacterium]|nr:MAG: adenylate/guanylate cyclase domain-containing protein [Campylobacterota bacterium]